MLSYHQVYIQVLSTVCIGATRSVDVIVGSELSYACMFPYVCHTYFNMAIRNNSNLQTTHLSHHLFEEFLVVELAILLK